jgi:hypothetical protein
MTVGDMLRRMSSLELTEWLAFAQIEPFGEWRDDFRTGLLAAVIANPHRKKGAPGFKPSDFMPLQRQAGADRVEEMNARARHGMRVLAARHRAKERT